MPRHDVDARTLPRTAPPDAGSRLPGARGLRSLRRRSGHRVTAAHAHAIARSRSSQTDSCLAPSAPSPIAVALVRRVDGSCAPIDQAFVYRCEPSQPAVAVDRRRWRRPAVPRWLVCGGRAHGAADGLRDRRHRVRRALPGSDEPGVPVGGGRRQDRALAGDPQPEQAERSDDRADDRRLDPGRRADGGRRVAAHVDGHDRRVDRPRVRGRRRRRGVAAEPGRRRGRDRDRRERRGSGGHGRQRAADHRRAGGRARARLADRPRPRRGRARS